MKNKVMIPMIAYSWSRKFGEDQVLVNSKFSKTIKSYRT